MGDLFQTVSLYGVITPRLIYFHQYTIINSNDNVFHVLFNKKNLNIWQFFMIIFLYFILYINLCDVQEIQLKNVGRMLTGTNLFLNLISLSFVHISHN